MQVDPELCSLQYTSVEKVARVAQRLGRGTLLAKLDVQAAYCLVPIHSNDRPLLGVKWGDACYFDRTVSLMLGTKEFHSSSRCIRVVSAAEWGDSHWPLPGWLHHNGCTRNKWVPAQPIKHSGQEWSLVSTNCTREAGWPIFMTDVFREWDRHWWGDDVPASREVGPNTICSWSQSQVCHRWQLESLIGLLQHACRVVWPGRSFLRRMISLLSHSYRPYYHICLWSSSGLSENEMIRLIMTGECWWFTWFSVVSNKHLQLLTMIFSWDYSPTWSLSGSA